MLGIHLGFPPSDAFHGNSEPPDWLLATSDWADAGVWVDTATWSD